MSVTRESLSYEVAAYLGLPRARRTGKAYHIIADILDVISRALQRGETVKIDGLGIFRVRVKPPMRKPCSDFEGKKVLNRYFKMIPAHKYVHFIPSKPILRNLNDNRVNQST